MYLGICVSMYLCTYVCMHACMYVRMYGLMYGYMDAWMHVCSYVRMYLICIYLICIWSELSAESMVSALQRLWEKVALHCSTHLCRKFVGEECASNVYICKYVKMQTWKYVCIYKYKYVHMHIRMYIVHMYIQIDTCTNICIYVCIYVCICEYMYVNMYVCMYACMHAGMAWHGCRHLYVFYSGTMQMLYLHSLLQDTPHARLFNCLSDIPGSASRCTNQLRL
jgi:hypothetical protein